MRTIAHVITRLSRWLESKYVAPGLTGSQWTSILVVAVCVWSLTLVRRTPRWGRWQESPNTMTPDRPAPDHRASDHRGEEWP